MEEQVVHQTQGWIPALRAFAARPGAARESHCGLCSAPIGAHHAHLLDRQDQRAMCACETCALLFDDPNPRYQRIPPKLERLAGLGVSDAQWQALGVPVDIAFFRYGPDARVAASYPGAAGAVHAIPDASAWASVVRANAVLAGMRHELEALLVNRRRGARDAFLVSIDRCFELVGLIRANWRGMGGGDEVWHAVDDFFERLCREAAGEVAA